MMNLTRRLRTGYSSPRTPGFIFLRRFRESRESLLLRLVVVEHHDELRHGEQLANALAQATDLHLAAPALVVRESSHQNADRHGVQRRAVRQVQHHPLISSGG